MLPPSVVSASWSNLPTFSSLPVPEDLAGWTKVPHKLFAHISYAHPCLTLSPHTYILSLNSQCLTVGPCALSEEDPIPSTVFRMKREGQVKRFTDTGPNTWLTPSSPTLVSINLGVNQPWCLPPLPIRCLLLFIGSHDPNSSHSTPLPAAARALSQTLT